VEQVSDVAVAEQVPVIDIGPYLAGAPGAEARAVSEVCSASESVGFFFLRNHGVPQHLIDSMFAESQRFHTLPLERKLEARAVASPIGYLPLGGQTQHTSIYGKSEHPDRSASFYIKEEYPPEHPDRVAKKPYVFENRWPAALPGFRETALEYFEAMAALGHRILRLHSLAIGMPAEFISSHEGFRAFTGNTLRLLQYPPRDPALEKQFGIGPHTDYGYGTLLAQGSLPGLEILTRSGAWLQAPALPGHLLFNNGDMCQRWTNDRFRSAPHRVINRSGETRYSIAFFINPRSDIRLECLPTCQGPGNPPRYEPISFGEYFAEIRKRNYTLPS
jgi:isopenicillin N synthase-like dioxygenase